MGLREKSPGPLRVLPAEPPGAEGEDDLQGRDFSWMLNLISFFGRQQPVQAIAYKEKNSFAKSRKKKKLREDGTRELDSGIFFSLFQK